MAGRFSRVTLIRVAAVVLVGTVVAAACSCTNGNAHGSAPAGAATGTVTGRAASPTSQPRASSSASPSGVAAATSPAPLTDVRSLTPARVGPLAKAAILASTLCRQPDVGGYCRGDHGALKRAADKVCNPFRTPILHLASALGINVANARSRSMIMSPSTVPESDDPWQVAEISCLFTRPGETLPAIGMKLGLLWRAPVPVDCTAFLIGTCTQLTPRLMRVINPDEQRFFYRVNGVLGGAQIDLINPASSTSTRPTPTADAAASKIAATIISEIDT